MKNLARPILAAAGLATIAGASLLASAGDAAANPGWTPECHSILVLAVDGTKGPTTPTSVDPKSPLNRIADTYRSIDDTSVEHIAYPGGMIPGVRGWNESYDESVKIGKSNLRTRIAQNEEQCGRDTNYVLLGYSQGARVVGDVAEEILSDRPYGDGNDIADRMVARVYSDPRGPSGVETLFPGEVMPGITLNGPRGTEAQAFIESTCRPGDGVCDATTPEESATWIFDIVIGFMLNHSNYGR